MPKMAAYLLVVSVRKGTCTLSAPKALNVSVSATFGEILIDTLQRDARVEKVRLYDVGGNADLKEVEVSLEMKVETAQCFSLRGVEFILKNETVDTLSSDITDSLNTTLPVPLPNAFNVLMADRKRLYLPVKHTEGRKHGQARKLNGPQQMHNDLVDFVEKQGCAWTMDMSDSADFVIGTLSNTLWYIDHCHDKFKEQSCPIPKLFCQFSGYNDFKTHRHKSPVVHSARLNELSNELIKALSMPSLNTKRNKPLMEGIEGLLDSIGKYKRHLDGDSANKREKRVDAYSAHTVENSANGPTRIKAKPSVKEEYLKLDAHLKSSGMFVYVDLDEFSPTDRLKRRKYITNLHTSMDMMIFRMAYGGCMGTLSFIWAVPTEGTPDFDSKMFEVVTKITGQLPKFCSRATQRDFIDKYTKYVEAPKSVSRYMFYELTGYDNKGDTKDQQEVDERTAAILLESDDSDLLLDYRSLNRQDVGTKFEEFFKETDKYFEEQVQLAVHERRHGDELYMPLAISIEDLSREVQKRLPDNTPVPSNETLRLQFQPTTSRHKTSMRCNGRFNVKYKVQTRQSRVFHKDSRYVATQYTYMKQLAVKHRNIVHMCCLDDKAIVPVGEPGKAVSTGVRGHNRVLAPCDGPQLVALDHDYHIAGLVPSVIFSVDVPSNAHDSFFTGSVYVTTKDKVFEPSTPFRHATELVKTLRENNSEDGVNLDRPVLLLFTDGGPDHRNTFDSVRLSLIQIFIQLDLDQLTALRTAPNHSWLNPAERCMSLLNLALQHAALARSEMDGRYERAMKSKNSLKAVRDIATVRPGFKEAFTSSVKPVIRTVNNRFSRMNLKGESIKVAEGATMEEIEDSLDVVKLFLQDSDLSPESTSKEVRDSTAYKDFLQKHTKCTHYCFQIRKCSSNNCAYCTIHPPRLGEDFQTIHFLPDPIPDCDKESYLPFDQVYGKTTTDEYRPSAHKTSDFDQVSVDEDQGNKGVLKAGKVRRVINCNECEKPRCVYTSLKLTNDQENTLSKAIEEEEYACGDQLSAESHLYTRRSLDCSSPIEVAYYGTTFLPPCCFHCGTLEDLLDNLDEYIKMLKEKYVTVRPLCERCKVQGLEAKTWGQKYLKGKKRKRTE